MTFGIPRRALSVRLAVTLITAACCVRAQCSGSTITLPASTATEVTTATTTERCFQLSGYVDDQWNAVGIVNKNLTSPASDWDISIANVISDDLDNRYDYIISDGIHGLPTHMSGSFIRFAGPSPAYVRHTYSSDGNNTLVVGTSYAGLNWNGGSTSTGASMSIGRLFKFNVTEVGAYRISIASSSPMRWRLHQPQPSGAWQTRYDYVALGSTVTNPVNVQLTTLGWYGLIVYQDRPVTTQPNDTYDLSIVRTGSLQPTLTSGVPTTVSYGAGALPLTLIGANFTPGTTVNVTRNGATTSLVGSYVNPNQYNVTLPAVNFTTVGTLAIALVNPGTPQSAPGFINVIYPIPTTSGLLPASGVRGSSPPTLHVFGGGFVPASYVTVNGNIRPTTFVSATELTTPLGPFDLALPGTLTIRATTPVPGGGTTSPLTFTVNNTVPSIASISPTSTTVGYPPPVITITGAGFWPDSAVTWDGVAHAFLYMGSGQLQVQLTETDVTTAGNHSLCVVNAPSGGGNACQTFTILNPEPYPSYVDPPCVLMNASPAQFDIHGSGFVAGCHVTFAGQVIAGSSVTFVHQGLIRFTAPAGTLATIGERYANVVNPGPGGGISWEPAVLAVSATPTLSAVVPSGAAAGQSSAALTITGTNFDYMSVIDVWDGNQVTEISPNFLGPTGLQLVLPPELLARPGQLILTARQSPPFDCALESPVPLTFEVRPPQIQSHQPTSHVPLVVGSGSYDVLLFGTGFALNTPGFGVVVNGTFVSTSMAVAGLTLVSQQATFLSLRVAPPFADATQIGALTITVMNGPLAPSNAVAVKIESAPGQLSNAGTIRTDPAVTVPGSLSTIVLDGCPIGQPFTLMLDVQNNGPVLIPDPYSTASAYLLRGFSPFAFVLCDGISIFGGPFGSCSTMPDPYATAPGGTARFGPMMLPTPPLGIHAAVQAVVLDPNVSLGLRLTWPGLVEL